MTVSYKWISEYLSRKPLPAVLSGILTSIGLEVEGMEKYESIKGSLEGLVVGEVLTCEPHPNADKLKLTRVAIGPDESLDIVCGAPNVAVGQKVIVARVGTTIYPLNSEPLTMRVATIRGVESHGMICAEDEIGMGESHAGILILPASSVAGTPVAAIFHPYEDELFEIGLTPNHMDAMSHAGIARDISAWLAHHENITDAFSLPSLDHFSTDNNRLPITVSIENTVGCRRYSGLTISGITVAESPRWIQDKLKAIGLRPVNNIVDITNFVLHEMGQPLHAFDAAAITGNTIIVKNCPAGTTFVTLDEKERKLDADDMMICNAGEPMCMAGVFGGWKSGVKATTSDIFLESAWFDPATIRKTSFRHGLRTDAAIHFEKGMDISNTVNALKRAALLIKEYAGGEISSNIIDVYPNPEQKKEVTLSYDYLQKLSGKKYAPEAVKKILVALGFEIRREEQLTITVATPFHKPDINLPADLVEEIMRIDGLYNVEIPVSITISPSVETDSAASGFKEKVATTLVSTGFYEIFTNSITNSAYYTEQELEASVKMINNLSAALNIMRPGLLETGLESIAYNLNRRNNDLKFFEFGKSYSTGGPGKYFERNHLCLYITGNVVESSWKSKPVETDLFYLKGVCNNVFQQLGISHPGFLEGVEFKLQHAFSVSSGNQKWLRAGRVQNSILQKFDIRQPVFFADFDWDALIAKAASQSLEFTELARQLPVNRDLSMVLNKSTAYSDIEKTIWSAQPGKLREIHLFDIFESDKLGTEKKSLAVSFSFLDEEKTMTDKEIDGIMGHIMAVLERDLKAEIRK